MKKTLPQSPDNIIHRREGRHLRPRMGKPKGERNGSELERILQKLKVARRRYKKANSPTRRWNNGRGIIVREAPLFAQRVIVKAGYIKMNTLYSKEASRSHLNYITRDSAGIDGENARAFNSDIVLGRDDLRDFLERAADCPHQFRFIVSPKNGAKLDLELFGKKLISKMESDLDSKLDYVGVVHYDTDNPHIHFVVNGRADNGKELRINPEYLKNGIRARGSEVATRQIGLRLELEVQNSLQKEISGHRFTSLDAKLLSIADQEKESPDAKSLSTTLEGKIVDLAIIPKDPSRSFLNIRGNLLGRLIELEKLELAYEAKPSVWVIDSTLKEKLQEIGSNTDIMQAVHSHIKDLPESRQLFILDHDTPVNQAITGKVLGKGLINELYDRKYMVVDGFDGNVYYAPLSLYSEKKGKEARIGDFVTLDNRPKQAYQDNKSRKFYIRVEMESSLSLEQQVRAKDKTMLDKFVGKQLNLNGTGLQKELAEAVKSRGRVLELVLERQLELPPFLERKRELSLELDLGF